MAEPTPPADAPEANPLTTIAIQTLSQAIEMLREDGGEVERQLVEQERKGVDGLVIELAEPTPPR